MARDRPSPYGEEKAFFIVARGPVPRERWIARDMARDRPSPYGDRGRRIGPTSVVCDRLITNGSGAGAPDLQR